MRTLPALLLTALVRILRLIADNNKVHTLACRPRSERDYVQWPNEKAVRDRKDDAQTLASMRALLERRHCTKVGIHVTHVDVLSNISER